MKNTTQPINRSALRRHGPPWRGPCAEPPHQLYRRFFNPPVLSKEAEARRTAAERYRAHLRKAYGEGVPENEMDDFEDGFRAPSRNASDAEACCAPEETLAGTGEGYLAGYRAGQHYKRQSASGEAQIPAYPNRHRPSDTLPASVLYTFEEAARDLSVSEDALQHFVRSGKLDTFEHSGRMWIHPKALVDYERRAEGRGAGR